MYLSLLFFFGVTLLAPHLQASTTSADQHPSDGVSATKSNDFIASLDRNCAAKQASSCSEREFVDLVERTLQNDDFELFGGVRISKRFDERNVGVDLAGDSKDLEEYVVRRIVDYTNGHVVSMDLTSMKPAARNARFLFGIFKPKWLDFDPTETGKSSFLTGFGLGFLAFGLKKLLLPFFIAAQIAKSVLLAMFLPSILGGLGKIVGKGVSTFASSSGGIGGLVGGLSGGGGLNGESTNTIEDFEFKDTTNEYDGQGLKAAESKYSFNYPDTGSYYQQPTGTLPASAIYSGANTRYQPQAAAKVSYVNNDNANTNYYQRHQTAKQDYKVFHNIPSSSLLLTNYDPFYSPLLSRLDSVFKQLGYDHEECRERLVCSMYRNPAKFAPYSNLVSAQLSRELNELRKPSSDNPDILRFFRYMKAAKDGQDEQDCFQLHPTCNMGSNSAHPPMVKTYNDINKLVQARRLSRQMLGKEQSVRVEGAKILPS